MVALRPRVAQQFFGGAGEVYGESAGEAFGSGLIEVGDVVARFCGHSVANPSVGGACSRDEHTADLRFRGTPPGTRTPNLVIKSHLL